MDSYSNIQESNGAFIEESTIEIDGHSFTSGGGMLAKRVDTGKYEGILYAYPKENAVGSWDGSIKIQASFTNSWVSNMGDERQNIYFIHEIDGEKRYFHGVYMRSGSDIVRCKEVKNWDN